MMCGGYYEEEMKDKQYYGPSTQFSSTPRFGKAAAVCELENIECNLDPYENRINFKNAKEEEKFMIAWGKIVAGSLSD
jgi:hypothetical protein